MSAGVVCVPEIHRADRDHPADAQPRRAPAPVVDANGALVGILAADDLLDLLAEELGPGPHGRRGQEREVRARLPRHD